MLPKKESLEIEFKSDLKKFDDEKIFEVIVALANTNGGDLYLGIEDDGSITGVHPAHKNITSLSAFIANHTIPPQSVRAEILELEKPVLKISVPKSSYGIVATISGKVLHRRIKADGTPESVPMYPYEFANRLSDLRMLDYSALPLWEGSLDDLDKQEIERLKQMISTYGGDSSLLSLSDEGLLKALGLVREDQGRIVPTIAGVLLVGTLDAMKRYVPTATATFQVLKG